MAAEHWFAPQHQSVAHPTKKERWVLQFMILAGIYALFRFIWWYVQPDHRGHPVLFWLLNISFAYKLLHQLYEWFYLAAIRKPEWHPPRPDLRVDMLTTYVPGEPYDMVVNTLRAMVAVQYPHNTYLCDEGDDPYLKQVCGELGVVHIYRGPDKAGAKAGNINYALQNHATGDFCVILDPDHVPVPEFLDRTLPYFDDPEVGYVQCIQAYSNFRESLIAKSAAQQTYFFYGPLMMGMHGRGTVQSIGANCTFRRAALDSIGGHATGLCEDMHTAMQLHAGKWKSVYVPESLSWGQVPANLAAFFQQQLKWSRGAFSLLFQTYPNLFTRFNWAQRLHYLLTPLYFLYGLIGLIDIGVPLLALLSSHSPLYAPLSEFLMRLSPVLLCVLLIRLYSQRFVYNQHERGLYFWGGILRLSTWWVYLLGLLYSLFGIVVPYIPTPKDHKKGSPLAVHLPNLIVLTGIVFSVLYGLNRDWTPYSLTMAGFAVWVALTLGTIVVADLQTEAILIPVRLRQFAQWAGHFQHQYIYRLGRTSLVAVLVTLAGILLASLELLPWRTTRHYINSNQFNLKNEVLNSGDTSVRQQNIPSMTNSDVPMTGLQNTCKQIEFDSISGRFLWLVDGQPFYLKGIVYNPEESTADQGCPLTRNQLKKDLDLIEAMGANALIRTVGTVYDYNFFNALRQRELKVICRLQTSAAINYLIEPEKAESQHRELLQLVKAYSAHPALLCWSVKSQTWTDLAKYVQPPQLDSIRTAFLNRLAELVIAVKQTKPDIPLLLEFTDSYEFAHCWPILQKTAPAIDLLGSTAHHPEQWEAFAQTVELANAGKPQLILEFGGADLWDTLVSGANDLYWYPERSSFEKARTYSKYWTSIEKNRGKNLGGAAYCWRDRLSVSATMTGITDFKGRLKPTYFALKEAWTGQMQTFPLHDLWLRSDYLFEHGQPYFRFIAQSANNLNKDLDLEWHLRDHRQEEVNSFRIGPSNRGDYHFVALREYHRYFGNGFTPYAKGLEARLLQSEAQPFQRVYLYISNQNGHVVTASFPVHSDRLVQRITQ